MRDGALTRRSALAVLGGGGAAAACAPATKRTPYSGRVRFRHGVASGDPAADGVVIWTRVSPDREGPVPVRWAVARDRGMRRLVASGEVITDSSRDYTVKVDVRGLKPDRGYYYAFLVNKQHTPVGRTRTLPPRGVRKLGLAVVSGAQHPLGFFNVYEAISQRKDVDYVVCLGDYLSEFGVAAPGAEIGMQLGRVPSPEVEVVSLEEYRMRHAQYKEDPDLQACHAAFPFIVAWDDHELAGGAWRGGADNHNPDQREGDYGQRRDVAMKAYYEWMPIREPSLGRPFEAINRAFRFGDLALLVMLETRLLARTQPLSYARDVPLFSTVWDFSQPDRPVAVAPGAPAPDVARILPTPFDMRGAEARPILDWKAVSTIDPKAPPEGVAFLPDMQGFLGGKAGDTRRALLGADQESWLALQLKNSTQEKCVWQVLGNQIPMARIKAPNLSGAPAALRQALAGIVPQTESLLPLTKYGPPLNLDWWDGYPAQRKRLYDLIRRAGENVIVLSGDGYGAWANVLTADDGKTPVADEFIAPSVTAPALGSAFAGSGIDPAALIKAANPEVKWTDLDHHGFVLLNLTRKDASARFFAVSTILSKDYKTSVKAAFKLAPGKREISPVAAGD